jgi:hypothetical protein
MGIEFLLAKECLLLGGLYRNHSLSLTTFLQNEDREQGGGPYFRLRLGMAHPNIEKMSISSKNIQENHDYSEIEEPFDAKYIVSGDEEDKIRRILDKDIQDKIMSVKNFCMRIDNHGAYIEEPLKAFGFDVAKFNSHVDTAIDIIERIETLGAEGIPYWTPMPKDLSSA